MDTKICRACQKEKPVNKFNKKTYKSGKKAHQSYCKICESERHKKYYEANKDKYFKKAKKHDQKKKDFVDSLKQNPCMDCGKVYPPYVMDFDHRDPKMKKYGVAFLRKGFSKKKILDEIKKCDLVCANCHRERTHGDK